MAQGPFRVGEEMNPPPVKGRGPHGTLRPVFGKESRVEL